MGFSAGLEQSFQLLLEIQIQPEQSCRNNLKTQSSWTPPVVCCSDGMKSSNIFNNSVILLHCFSTNLSIINWCSGHLKTRTSHDRWSRQHSCSLPCVLEKYWKNQVKCSCDVRHKYTRASHMFVYMFIYCNVCCMFTYRIGASPWQHCFSYVLLNYILHLHFSINIVI